MNIVKLNDFSLSFSVTQLSVESLRNLMMMGSSGLEPPTSCLSGTRSNHLSYEPVGSAHTQTRRPLSRDCFQSLDSLVRLEWSSFFGVLTVDGDDGIRTHDPLLAGQVLSQLSYTPTLFLPHSISHSMSFPLKAHSKLNNKFVRLRLV